METSVKNRLDALRFAREAAWWQNEIHGMVIVDDKFQFIINQIFLNKIVDM